MTRATEERARPSDDGHPIRVGLLRLARQVSAHVDLLDALTPRFAAWHADPGALMVRLHGLLEHLLRTVLPLLRAGLYPSTTRKRSRVTAPTRGRLDPIGRFRARATGDRQWHMVETVRDVQTPANVLLATCARDVLTRLDRLERMPKWPVETRTVQRTRYALERLLGMKLMRAVVPGPLLRLPRLERQARRNAASWRRVAPFVEWRRALMRTQINLIERPDGQPVPFEDHFALAVHLGLVLHLRTGPARRIGDGYSLTLGRDAPTLQWSPDPSDRILRLLLGSRTLRILPTDLDPEAIRHFGPLLAPDVIVVGVGADPPRDGLVMLNSVALAEPHGFDPLLHQLTRFAETRP